jgi:hypothetical protein
MNSLELDGKNFPTFCAKLDDFFFEVRLLIKLVTGLVPEQFI